MDQVFLGLGLKPRNLVTSPHDQTQTPTPSHNTCDLTISELPSAMELPQAA